MEKFIAFFEHLTNLQKVLWIVVCMTTFWLIEGNFPLRKLHYKKWLHAKVNLVLLGSTIAINAIFGIMTAGIFIWQAERSFGMFYLVNWPAWIELILAVMLLDFIAQFVVHYLLHKVKFMWKFHMVHHSDTVVDVTTGTRHHPIDYVMREVFSLAAIFISGMPLAYYIFYRILTIFFTYFSHSNISLPARVDKALSLVFVSPNMHKFHHHHMRPWTDTNYGNIFSIWDRIFGTLVYEDPKDIVYGVDVLPASKSDVLSYQLLVPFDNSIKTDR